MSQTAKFRRFFFFSYTKQKQIHMLLFYETVVRKNAYHLHRLFNIRVCCNNKIGAVKRSVETF